MSEIQIAPKREFFSWLPNYLVNDPNVSAEALACALYLNGKPAGWRARPFDLRKRFGWGDRKWRKISTELKAHRLLHEKITKDGTILWFDIPESATSPVDTPTVHFSGPPKADRAKCTPLEEKEFTNKDLLIKKENNVLSENDTKEIFNKLWEMYPLKKAKQKALEAFIKLLKGKSKEEAEKLAKTIWGGLRACIEEHQAKTQLQEQGGDVWVPNLPHLSTWLNQARWGDDYQQPSDILASTKHKKGLLDIRTIFN